MARLEGIRGVTYNQPATDGYRLRCRQNEKRPGGATARVSRTHTVEAWEEALRLALACRSALDEHGFWEPPSSADVSAPGSVEW